MQITLTPDAERFVQAQMQGGRYANAEAVILAAIQLLEQQQHAQQTDIQHIYQDRFVELKQAIAVGAEQLDNGLGIDGKPVIQRLT